MPERAAVYERTFIGVEALGSVGTRVRPTRELTGIGIKFGPDITVNTYRPDGYKYPTTASKGMDWTVGKLAGQADYNELLWPLAGLITQPVTTNLSGAAYQHVFTPAAAAANNFRSLTLVAGSESVRTHETTGLMINGLELGWSREKIDLSGDVFGKLYRDDRVRFLQITGTPTGGTIAITIGANTASGIAYNASTSAVQSALEALASVGTGNVTAWAHGGTLPAGVYALIFADSVNLDTYSVASSLTGGTLPAVTLTRVPPGTTAVALQPIAPEHWSFYFDDTSGALGTTKFNRVLGWSMGISDVYNQVWPGDAAQSSWAAPVEKDVTTKVTIKVSADTQGMGLLATLRSGALKWLRAEAVGPQITGSYYHRLRIDGALRLVGSPKEFTNERGVFSAQFEAEFHHDPTWGQPYQITLHNTMVSL